MGQVRAGRTCQAGGWAATQGWQSEGLAAPGPSGNRSHGQDSSAQGSLKQPEWSCFKQKGGVRVRRTWEGPLEPWAGRAARPGRQPGRVASGAAGLPREASLLGLCLCSAPRFAFSLCTAASWLLPHLMMEDALSPPHLQGTKLTSGQLKSSAGTSPKLSCFHLPRKGQPAEPGPPPPAQNKGLCIQGLVVRAGRCPSKPGGGEEGGRIQRRGVLLHREPANHQAGQGRGPGGAGSSDLAVTWQIWEGDRGQRGQNRKLLLSSESDDWCLVLGGAKEMGVL